MAHLKTRYGTDSPGRYYVQKGGDYYVLTTTRSADGPLLGLFLIGAVIAGVGVLSYRRDDLRLASAALAAVATLGVL